MILRKWMMHSKRIVLLFVYAGFTSQTMALAPSAVLEKNTWFNLSLQQDIQAKIGSQNFTAILDEPIYNSDFSALLIPANALAHGVYSNDGLSCKFVINKITFDGRDINLTVVNYSPISVPISGVTTCDVHKNYLRTQIMDFRSLEALKLSPVAHSNLDKIADSTASFVQTFGNNNQYIIDKINVSSGELIEVTIHFVDKESYTRFIPVFYDNYEISHPVNYSISNTDDQGDVTYLFTSRYSKFGFALTGK